MDMTDTIAAKSDQQNYDDYLGGQTRTVTISAVTKGSAEQPVDVELAEYPGRPFKPNKTMRRVLVLAWGTDSTAYVGRRLTLFGNAAVVYGGKAVGGIEISHMSDLEKPLTVALTAKRGQRKNFTVTPLAAEVARNWQADIDAATDTDTLTAIYTAARATPGAYTDELKQAFGVRGAAIKASNDVEF